MKCNEHLISTGKRILLYYGLSYCLSSLVFFFYFWEM